MKILNNFMVGLYAKIFMPKDLMGRFFKTSISNQICSDSKIIKENQSKTSKAFRIINNLT